MDCDKTTREAGTFHTPTSVVHFRRSPFNDPYLPPFWVLTVENSKHRYRVLVGVPRHQLELVMARLPEPTEERHGVDFRCGVERVVLPEDIRRLTGETMMVFYGYTVVSAPSKSPYREGQKFNDADLARRITATERDYEASGRREEALLRQFEIEIAERKIAERKSASAKL